MSLTFDSARIPNPHLTEDHLAWRDALRRFIDKEIMPYAEDWDEAGHIPIELWPKAAEVGLLGAGYPEQYGGMETDSWHNWIINEELSRVGVGGLSASLMVHSIGLPPVINWGTEEFLALARVAGKAGADEACARAEDGLVKRSRSSRRVTRPS